MRGLCEHGGMCKHRGSELCKQCEPNKDDNKKLSSDLQKQLETELDILKLEGKMARMGKFIMYLYHALPFDKQRELRDKADEFINIYTSL